MSQLTSNTTAFIEAQQYSQFILDNLHELRNENYINYQYENIIKKDWNKDILKTEWWKNKILYEN